MNTVATAKAREIPVKNLGTEAFRFRGKAYLHVNSDRRPYLILEGPRGGRCQSPNFNILPASIESLEDIMGLELWFGGQCVKMTLIGVDYRSTVIRGIFQVSHVILENFMRSGR